jgi:hypothetical protein
MAPKAAMAAAVVRSDGPGTPVGPTGTISSSSVPVSATACGNMGIVLLAID